MLFPGKIKILASEVITGSGLTTVSTHKQSLLLFHIIWQNSYIFEYLYPRVKLLQHKKGIKILRDQIQEHLSS